MGHIITLAQQKGGSGKTTILIHLAEAWAEAGRSVAVADLDPQGTLTRWHGTAAASGGARAALIETKDYRAGSDLRAAAEAHDVVLVDCPGSASRMLETALRESDLVLAPCQPSPMDVWALEAMHAMARAAKTPLRVVLNRVPPRGTGLEATSAALTDQGITPLTARLGNRVAFSRGIGDGRSALSGPRKSAARSEVAALLTELDRVLAAL